MVDRDCIIVHSQDIRKKKRLFNNLTNITHPAAADNDTKSKLLDLSLVVNAANQVKNALYPYFSQAESEAYNI